MANTSKSSGATARCGRKAQVGEGKGKLEFNELLRAVHRPASIARTQQAVVGISISSIDQSYDRDQSRHPHRSVGLSLPPTLAVLTMHMQWLLVSDTAAADAAADKSGPTIREVLSAAGYDCRHLLIVPDDETRIRETVRAWCAQGDVDWVLTTGGTGFGVRDRTPEVRPSPRPRLSAPSVLLDAKGVYATTLSLCRCSVVLPPTRAVQSSVDRSLHCACTCGSRRS